MATKKIRGKQLYLFLNDEPLGWSSDCSLTLTANTIEISPSGKWSRYRAGRRSWEVSCSGFYSIGSGASLNIISGAQNIGRSVSVATTVLSEALIQAGIDIEKISPSSEHTVVGDAIITSCEYTGSVSGLATYRVTLRGSGPLGILSTTGGFPYILPIIFE